MQRKTVLIIKHGFSETCDHSVSPLISYGEVFRCTCLLEDFKGWHVTWITSAAPRDLLIDNHLIDNLVFADSPEQIPPGHVQGHYHTVINLEKQADWCRFAAVLGAELRYGFKDPAASGDDCYYRPSAKALAFALERSKFCAFQETLFESVGRQWTGQRYVLGYRPRVNCIYDIGLNHHIGPKWPTKAWPERHWRALAEQLSADYSVCWQQSLNSVRHYIDWLASCRLIVTCDSLGLHLALGLNKKVVGLFGPTPPEQVYTYGCGIKLTAPCERSCLPCFEAECTHLRSCMEYISVETVAEAVDTLLGARRTSRGRLRPKREILVPVG